MKYWFAQVHVKQPSNQDKITSLVSTCSTCLSCKGNTACKSLTAVSIFKELQVVKTFRKR